MVAREVDPGATGAFDHREQTLPAPHRVIFPGDQSRRALTSGYLSTQVFSFFLPAILLVFAVGRGAATLAGEEQDRTLDLLLAQPLPRWSAYLQNALALAVSLVIIGIAILVPLAAFNSAVQFNLAVGMAAVVVQTVLFCLALALWSQAISAAVGRRVVGVAAVTGYAVVSYFVYGLSSSIEWLQHLRPLTLWRWSLGYDPLTSGFGGSEFLVLCATGAVAVGVGLWAFDRRDLHNYAICKNGCRRSGIGGHRQAVDLAAAGGHSDDPAFIWISCR